MINITFVSQHGDDHVIGGGIRQNSTFHFGEAFRKPNQRNNRALKFQNQTKNASNEREQRINAIMGKQGQRSNCGRGNTSGGGKNRKSEAERLADKAIIHFKIQQLNEMTVSCKFQDSTGQEIKEYISNCDTHQASSVLNVDLQGQP